MRRDDLKERVNAIWFYIIIVAFSLAVYVDINIEYTIIKKTAPNYVAKIEKGP